MFLLRIISIILNDLFYIFKRGINQKIFMPGKGERRLSRERHFSLHLKTYLSLPKRFGISVYAN